MPSGQEWRAVLTATTNISDDFTVGFPVGITVRKSQTFAFDLEFVPLVQNEPLDVDLTVHPGVLWGFADKWNAGIRVAFDVNPAVVGFHAAGQLRVRRRRRREFALRRTGRLSFGCAASDGIPGSVRA